MSFDAKLVIDIDIVLCLRQQDDFAVLGDVVQACDLPLAAVRPHSMVLLLAMRKPVVAKLQDLVECNSFEAFLQLLNSSRPDPLRHCHMPPILVQFEGDVEVVLVDEVVYVNQRLLRINLLLYHTLYSFLIFKSQSQRLALVSMKLFTEVLFAFHKLYMQFGQVELILASAFELLHVSTIFDENDLSLLEECKHFVVYLMESVLQLCENAPDVLGHLAIWNLEKGALEGGWCDVRDGWGRPINRRHDALVWILY